MPQEELDLLQLASRSMAEPSTGPSQIVWRQLRHADALGGFPHNVPNRLTVSEPEAKQWARKRFIETYVRYGELQQEQFLLPDGKLKELFANAAKTKALPEVTR